LSEPTRIKVIRFNVIPKNCINIKVPINDTGAAIAGINVERQSPKRENYPTLK
jgi:hypothetical protein